MQISALTFRPYIYNTNMLSSRSLSRIAPIGDDLTAGKTDFSDLTDERLNRNPLRKGQTLNFMDILGRQMQSGRLRASRIMKEEETPVMTAVPDRKKTGITSADQMPEEADDLLTKTAGEERTEIRAERNLFQMQRAAQAYLEGSMLFT